MSNINYPEFFCKTATNAVPHYLHSSPEHQNENPTLSIIRSSTPHATDLPINNNNTSHYYSASTSDSPVTYSSPPYFLGIKIQNLHCRDSKAKLFFCFPPAQSTPLFSFACVVVRALLAFLRAAQPSRGDGDVIFTKFTTSKTGQGKTQNPTRTDIEKTCTGKV
jgi:hypothetical protein